MSKGTILLAVVVLVLAWLVYLGMRDTARPIVHVEKQVNVDALAK